MPTSLVALLKKKQNSIYGLRLIINQAILDQDFTNIQLKTLFSSKLLNLEFGLIILNII